MPDTNDEVLHDDEMRPLIEEIHLDSSQYFSEVFRSSSTELVVSQDELGDRLLWKMRRIR
jgi:hypothetical protein